MSAFVRLSATGGPLMRHRPLLIMTMAAALLAVTGPAAPAREYGAAANDYVVVLRDSVTRPMMIARSQNVRVSAISHVYRHALKGYAATLSGPMVASLRADPRVESVTLDGTVSIAETQTGATWGIDRIDQPGLPLSTTYDYVSTGLGVTAYVIDTGINIAHTDFGGRAVNGWDFIGKDQTAEDCNGHGTHVAGTIGGTTYGVAKQVTLVAVRVLDCNGSGSFSGVIAGIDWVTGVHAAGAPAVANMSLGGGAYKPVDTAVANSIADGVVYAVAAGNSNADACRYSPARTPAAITVAATTMTDARATYSNYGRCVDINAPGSSITSAWSTSVTATNTISGTSMATPHVAGAAARYLQQFPSSTPTEVRDALYVGASRDVVTGISKRPYNSTPNRLLYLAPGT